MLPSTSNNETFRNYWEEMPMSMDIYVYECGYERCSPLHFYDGNQIHKSGFLVHIILSGHGKLKIANTTYELGKNQGFIISPGFTDYMYIADAEDPWEYRWISFCGLHTEKILKQSSLPKNGVFNCSEDNQLADRLKIIYESSINSSALELRVLGNALLFLAELITQIPSKNTDFKNIQQLYLDNSLEFIQHNLEKNISVSDLASIVGVSRSYLYKIFIKYLGESPMNYIEGIKMSAACRLLISERFNILEVAAKVGYYDVSYFSRVFKKVNHMSPRKYIHTYSKSKNNM